MQPAWESSDCSMQIHEKRVSFLLTTALKYACIYISIMRPILRMMRVLQLLCRKNKKNTE